MTAVAIVLLVKYLFDDFLMMYFYSKVLGRKYTLKTTIFYTFVWWMIQDITKILVFLGIGFVLVDVIQVCSLLIWGLYTIVVFKSTIGKKIFASIWICSLLVLLELLSYIPASILTGEFALMQADSNFTILVVLIQSPFEVLGTLLSIRLWKWVEQIEWKADYQQLIWLIFPLSQMCFLLHVAIYYTLDAIHVPVMIYIGLLLGIVTDIYACCLFIQSNQKEKVEKELKYLKAQYDFERVRYEELMKSEEEMQKIRHDYANYCMTLRNM